MKPCCLEPNTRQQLIIAALKLFAEQGVNAVSLRAVNQAAGAKNSGAVHYYFNNKQGLLEGVVGFLLDEVVRLRGDALDLLLARSEPAGVEEILSEFFRPYWLLHFVPDIGPASAKLLMALHTEPNAGVQQLFATHEAPYWQKLEALLQRALPGKNPAWLRLHIALSWINVLVGLSSLNLMPSSPLGDLRFASQDEMLRAFTTYLAAGLASR